MRPPSHRRRRWRRSYPIFVQIGLAMALLLLILAFRMDWQPPAPEERFRVVEERPVLLVEVPATRIERPVPPSPMPPPPIEVPDETLIEDDRLRFDATLNLDDALETPLPPIGNDGSEDPHDPDYTFVVVEQEPELIGGLEALYEKISYPDMALRAGIEGQVIVRFVVNPEGNVTELVVQKSVHPLLDAAAVEALRQMRFTPGRQRGRAVRVQLSMPVRFALR